MVRSVRTRDTEMGDLTERNGTGSEKPDPGGVYYRRMTDK